MARGGAWPSGTETVRPIALLAPGELKVLSILTDKPASAVEPGAVARADLQPSTPFRRMTDSGDRIKDINAAARAGHATIDPLSIRRMTADAN